MEDRFGWDFSAVRVHNGPQAKRWAESIGARALTVGRNIVLPFGEYSTQSSTGCKLLGHELAHVMQQENGSANISIGSNAHEREAAEIAERMVHSNDPLSVNHSTGLIVAAQSYQGKYAISAEDLYKLLISLRGHALNPGVAEIVSVESQLAEIEGQLEKDPNNKELNQRKKQLVKILKRDVRPRLSAAQTYLDDLDAGRKTGKAPYMGLGKGFETVGIIGVSDNSGKYLKEWTAGIYDEAGHAEIHAMETLARRLQKNPVPGGHMMIVVDQDVCPGCQKALKAFVKEHKLSGVVAYVFERPGASPKTSIITTTKRFKKLSPPPVEEFTKRISFQFANPEFHMPGGGTPLKKPPAKESDVRKTERSGEKGSGRVARKVHGYPQKSSISPSGQSRSGAVQRPALGGGGKMGSMSGRQTEIGKMIASVAEVAEELRGETRFFNILRIIGRIVTTIGITLSSIATLLAVFELGATMDWLKKSMEEGEGVLAGLIPASHRAAINEAKSMMAESKQISNDIQHFPDVIASLQPDLMVMNYQYNPELIWHILAELNVIHIELSKAAEFAEERVDDLAKAILEISEKKEWAKKILASPDALKALTIMAMSSVPAVEILVAYHESFPMILRNLEPALQNFRQVWDTLFDERAFIEDWSRKLESCL
jgi:hypothetical protein